MKIYGLQKMTLLDFPEHVACTVFLNGCDFRCPFCHNFELVDGSAPPVMEEPDLISFLEKRRGLLDGVAFTGGEPCLHKDLPDLIAKIRSMGFLIKLDTNGYHPEMLSRLLSEGLVDYAAMDVKNSIEKYAVTAGIPSVSMDRIRESIALLKDRGGSFDYEFRTTVIQEFHTEEDIRRIGEMIRGASRYFLQPFTDRDTVPYGNLHAPGRETLDRFLMAAREFVPAAQIRGFD